MAYKRLDHFLIHLDSVDSTNNYAAELLKSQKVPEGTVILTDQQVKGRGQRSNVWTTEANKNLTVSLIFFPSIHANQTFYLNIAVSLAIRKALEMYSLSAKIKWPNDILIDGKKICGILFDNQISGKKIKYAIAGIGLNINQENFEGIPHATSMKLEKNKNFSIKEVLDEVYKQMDFYYDLLQQFNFNLLKKHYYQYLYKYGEMNLFKDAQGEFEGTIEGIDENGLLLIRTSAGKKKTYDIKEIEYR